jgi:uncharacterized protein YecT (DUF1311 family)
MGLAQLKKRSSLRRAQRRWLKVRQTPTGELRVNGEIGVNIAKLSSGARSAKSETGYRL